MSIILSNKESDNTTQTAPNSVLEYQLNAKDFQFQKEILGQGGFGKVYRAKCLRTGKQLAIKIVNDLETAGNEARIYSLISKLPHALKFYGKFFTEQKKPALVFQLFGTSLASFLKTNGHSLTYSATLRIIQQLVECLLELKSRGVLHRDIKTDNILIKTNDGQKWNNLKLKLCDFGLAIDNTEKRQKYYKNKIGTVFYMPPETLKFGEHSQKSQIWSLGIIIYFLFYKKFPLQRSEYQNQHSLYFKLLSKSIKFPIIPQNLAKLCQKCLNPNQQRRITLEQFALKFRQEFIWIQKMTENHSAKSNISTQQNSEKNRFILIQLFVQLQKRVNSLDHQNNIQKQILQQCQTLIKSENIEVKELVKTIQINSLQNLFKKMKMICNYAKEEKQVLFNLKQFMVADTLLTILEILSTFWKPGKNCSISYKAAEEHLQLKGQPKIISDYLNIKQRLNSIQKLKAL